MKYIPALKTSAYTSFYGQSLPWSLGDEVVSGVDEPSQGTSIDDGLLLPQLILQPTSKCVLSYSQVLVFPVGLPTVLRV